jgi:hypothetical protein
MNCKMGLRARQNYTRVALGSGAGAGGTAGTGSGGSGGAGLFTITVQLASAVKSTAPTTVGIVTWSISVTGITSAHIDFGLDTSYGMTAPVDLTAANYRTLLLGMKPAMTYHFRVVASNGTNTYERRLTVTTGVRSAPCPHQLSVKNAAAVPKGSSSLVLNGTGSKVIFIRHRRGRSAVRPPSESSDGISRARMSADARASGW